ncbi:MAG TPA: single-stranded-DNA-specific exonuclease RecJ [Gemmatales bacterium]|nr:single-stranded-DNA-specific exonuclease RecJ [Gemmatales bacterium]
MVPKRWRLLTPSPELARTIAESLPLPLGLAQLLVHRGVQRPESARQFLTCALSDLHDPATLPGVPEAARRLHAAVLAGRRVCVYGDYDVDGITGTTLLWRCLRLAGGDADYYVPERFEEGYGLNFGALRKLKERGIDTVVTVDCGITSVAEAQAARELGLELIITDHHEPRSELPAADVLVHPRLPDSGYPFPQLCGAGVAFKLAWALGQEFSQARKVSAAFRTFLLESVALVALGTVADVVPLWGENRIFVHHGLKSLATGPSIGLKALLEAAELSAQKDLDSEHIGFTLAPRLNAAGRLGSARLAIELLATQTPQRADDLARYLNAQNEQRQKVERQIFHAAKERVEAQGDLDDWPALVLEDADWHAGVIGIVASRLVERFARPVLMISTKDDPAQGSGRSVEGFPLHEALAACGQHLLSHGGHAMAAGFKVPTAAIPEFRAAFCAWTRERLPERRPRHTLRIDAEVPLAAVTSGLLKGLAMLQPYGAGNARPHFLATGLELVGEPLPCGQSQRHLRFRVRQEGGPPFRAIAFGMGDRLAELQSGGGACSLVFTPKHNEWNGFTSIDLQVQDFQPRARPELE